MLVIGVAFWQVILAVHILAVVVAFGVVFAYPLFGLVGRRIDPRALPWFHRMQVMVSQRLTSPGLLIVLLAGIYLASDLHQWKRFYVQWGIAAVIVLGAVEGAYMTRGHRRLAELAERDIGSSQGREVQFSQEYEDLVKRVGGAGTILTLIVIVTIYLMTVQA
jgi:hypothetical protein